LKTGDGFIAAASGLLLMGSIAACEGQNTGQGQGQDTGQESAAGTQPESPRQMQKQQPKPPGKQQRLSPKEIKQQ
jgi:hypothetical protein